MSSCSWKAWQLSGFKSHHHNLVFSIFIIITSQIIIIIMSSLCFKPIISWHRIRLIVCTKQSITGECCLEVRRVSSWSYYGLKWVILWQFGFCFSLFSIIWYHPVYEYYNHVQCWKPNIPTSFTVRHNNNKKNNIDKLYKQLWEGIKEVVLVWFQPWTCLWFSWTGGY